ncbi:MAG: hypothetical protein WBE69_07345 [Candidatus Binataceae bacterium]|jgi:hypothetical protein
MGKLLCIEGKITKRQMSARSEAASLRLSHYGDEVVGEIRDLEIKILAIGYYVAPRWRAEFQHALDYIQNRMPLDRATIRCVSICLDVLRERYAA